MGGPVGGGMQQPGMPLQRNQMGQLPQKMSPAQTESQTGVDPRQQGQMPQGPDNIGQMLRGGLRQGMPQSPQQPGWQGQGQWGGAGVMPYGMGGGGGGMGAFGGSMGGFGGPMGGFGGPPMAGYGMGGSFSPQAMGGLLGGMQGGCPPWMPGCGGGGYGGGWSGAAPMYGGARGYLQPSTPIQQQAPVQQPTAPTTSPNGTTVGYSDAQLKTDIEPMEDGLDVVLRIEPVRFKWKEGEGELVAGMIAQQVEEVLPEAVIEINDGYKGIDSLAVIGALVGAVKALTDRLEALEAK